MTDLISRQDAIAWLRGHVRIKDNDYARGVEHGISQAIEALTNMPSAESGWQPIETAPRDGTPILVFGKSGEFWGEPLNESWFNHSKNGIFVALAHDDDPPGIWKKDCSAPCDNTFYLPTHWLPVEPPK